MPSIPVPREQLLIPDADNASQSLRLEDWDDIVALFLPDHRTSEFVLLSGFPPFI